MHIDDPPLYPAKRNNSPSGDFTIRQYFLPVRIQGEEVWALLDTGANISIMPKEVATQILPRYARPSGSGTYYLGSLIGVPYSTYKLNLQLLEHIEGTLQEMVLEPYAERGKVVSNIRRVEFQVLDYTWPEIANKIETEAPISASANNLNFVIFGLYGVLDQLSVSIVGNNSVQVHPKTPG